MVSCGEEEEDGITVLVLFAFDVADAGIDMGGSAGRMNIEAGDGAIVVGLMCIGMSRVGMATGYGDDCMLPLCPLASPPPTTPRLHG